MVCQEPECVAEATKGEYCAVHGAGFRRVDGWQQLYCQCCERKLREGEWYQTRGGRVFHVAKNCQPPTPAKRS